MQAELQRLSNRDAKFAIGDSVADAGAPRLIRSALLTAYAEAARSIGLDPFRMLRKVGLPTSALEHPDFRIPADRVRQLVDISAEAAGREDFGLMVGREFKLSMKGPLGLLMREQPTVRAAVEVLARYLKYQDDSVEIRLEAQDDGLLFEPVLLSARARADRQTVELTVAKYVQLLRALLGPAWRPQGVRFTHDPPEEIAPYLEMFGRVEFSVGVNGIALSRADLDVEFPSADPDMAREIARYIERNAAQQSATMTDRVTELIKRLLPAGHCTIDRVAQHLGVDRRTVHRRLVQEGKSFTQLVNEARKDLVAAQLGQRDQPLGVVANLLGFSSLSTFSRWFRQTYGVPASEFRNAPQR
jgi:AraC-like DNA-binding protein